MVTVYFSMYPWLPKLLRLAHQELSGPTGASSPEALVRPSSRGTSTAIVSSTTMCSAGNTHEEPHGGAEAGSHESVQRSDRVDVDGVVGRIRVFWRAHGDG